MRGDVVVRDAGPKGRGVFALRDFQRGEFIFRRRHGQVVTSSEIGALAEEERRHLCELDYERSAVLLAPGCYLNHSCDPNAMRSGVKVFAWRDINAGDEITIDYRLNAFGGESAPCACDSASCTGSLVADFFSLDSQRQLEYLPYAPVFIRREHRSRTKAGVSLGTVLSFGYGSNLCLDRLENRLQGPGAVVAVGVGYLEGHELRFHKRSQDEHGDPRASGKGNALRTGKVEDRVWGVVFQIERGRLPLLDAAEGLGEGYARKVLAIRLADQGIEIHPFVYVATNIDDTLVPYDWYKRLVVNGLRSWPGIPPEYVGRIEANVQSRIDPLHRRAQREFAWACPSQT